jgi:uncharacterized membrane protein YbhN (UPF0104 family)
VAGAVAAIIAVSGTLLGSALTYAFRRRSAERTLAHEFGRQLRAERLAAYSGLAGSAPSTRFPPDSGAALSDAG